MTWNQELLYYPYHLAANPVMPKVPIKTFPPEIYNTATESQVLPFDLSDDLETPYPATGPTSLMNYIVIKENSYLSLRENASSHLFYVIEGKGICCSGNNAALIFNKGDVFTLSAVEDIVLESNIRTVLYWINDSPLLHYLGVAPIHSTFRPTHYPHQWLQEKLNEVKNRPNAKNQNRNGIILAHPHLPLIKTITPVHWALFNVIFPGQTQPPHRHNSLAMDFCVSQSPGVYTLVGEQIDEKGQIINPIRVDWEQGGAFLTPPGLWHSHHNESDNEAIIMPIQDAGLSTYQRILDIQFSTPKTIH